MGGPEGGFAQGAVQARTATDAAARRSFIQLKLMMWLIEVQGSAAGDMSTHSLYYADGKLNPGDMCVFLAYKWETPFVGDRDDFDDGVV